MGVTIESKTHNIDIGYSDFWRLRVHCAELCDRELGESYRYFTTPSYVSPQEGEEVRKTYDAAVARIQKKIGPRRLHYFEDFLWDSDAGGIITCGTCRYLLKLLEDDPNGRIIGYPGWGDNAPRMKDLREILRESIDTQIPVKWY